MKNNGFKFGHRNILGVFLALLALLMGACSEKDSVEDYVPTETKASVKFSIKLECPEMESTLIGYPAEGVDGNTDFYSHFNEGASRHVFVKQNGKMIELGDFKVVISESDNSVGVVSVDAKDVVTAGQPYDVYLVGGAYRYDNNGVYFRRNLTRKSGFYSWYKFSSSTIPTKADGKIDGTVEMLFVINKSGAPIKFKHKGFDVANRWYHTYGEVSIDNGTVTEYEDGKEEEGEVREVPVFTGENATIISSYYVPSGNKISEAQLIAEIDGKEVRSENRISSDLTIQLYHSYAMFAVWDGEKLRMGDENGEAVVKIELPEGTNLSVENLTILGDGEEIDVNNDGTLSSKPANLIAFNNDGEIVYMSYGSSNEERVLGPVETALALLLPTVPNAVTDFDSEHLLAFKVMTALLKPTYDLVQAIKESIIRYNCLNMDAIQPQLTEAVRELQRRCGLDKESLSQAPIAGYSPWRANNSNERPSYPYFADSYDKTIRYDFITVQMTDAQLKEKDGSKYWACMFDVYNDNRFCYTSFTKSLKTANGFDRYDDSWADTFRYLIKPYNLSEFMDLGLLSDLAYDPEHFLTTLIDYDYSDILNDPVIAQFWEPFVKDRITTYDKTVKRDIGIDLFTANEHLLVVGPGNDDNLLLFNLVKLIAQPMLKMAVKSDPNPDDLDKFTEEFIKWIADVDVSFRADLLQHFKDPSYSMWEKLTYTWDKLSERIAEYVMDKLYDAASEEIVERLFGNGGNLALKEYKKIMDLLKTGYTAVDIFEFILDGLYKGWIIEIEHGFGETNGTIPDIPGSDF